MMKTKRMKITHHSDKVNKRSRAYHEAQVSNAYEAGRMEGATSMKKSMAEDLNIRKTQANTALLHAAAEVAVCFSKVMYNINMLVNETRPFNQPSPVAREMRFTPGELTSHK
jgi:hypothetical protein